MPTPIDQTPSDLPSKLDEMLEKIGSALGVPETRYADLAELDREVAEIRQRLTSAKSEANETLLNPGRPRSELRSAQDVCREIELDLSRLEYSAAKLDCAIHERIAIEQEEARAAAYDAAMSFRDAMVAEITGPVANHLAELVDHIQRLMECNEAVDNANRNLPKRRRPLNRPEGEARGFADFSDETPAAIETFRLTQMLVPDLKDRGKLAWPAVAYLVQILPRGKSLSQKEVRRVWRGGR